MSTIAMKGKSSGLGTLGCLMGLSFKLSTPTQGAMRHLANVTCDVSPSWLSLSRWLKVLIKLVRLFQSEAGPGCLHMSQVS